MNISGSELREAIAQSVRVSDDAPVADLADGRTIAVPLAWYPRLAHGTPTERVQLATSLSAPKLLRNAGEDWFPSIGRLIGKPETGS
jgi:hypothetical protein